MIEKVVIFDWSGTLSPDAVRFAEDNTLTEELERSGLAALGAAAPETFWEKIVNPTWEEGSTTPIGYGEAIFRRIKEAFFPTATDDQIRISAARFVDSYLTHSSIDGRWRSILGKLGNDPAVMTMIATDHYAEATAYIVQYLGEMGAGAMPLKDALGASVPSPFIVANSADMGAHKADHAFWDTLKGALGLDGLRSVMIVDDFGFNEGAGDSYADRQKVEDRKGATLSLLEGVFGVPVQSVSFMWERVGAPEKDEKALGDLIARASAEIEGYLS
ncbi:MAG: hypothetical protein JRD89_17000 [Deltaproteobacteria bacterium]|nr:hypothetical protein [Deltaproteobacteria bacterium]